MRRPFHNAGTVLCSLTWDAVVTFTRTGDREEDPVIADVPITPEPQPDPEDDLIVALARARFAVEAGAQQRVTVRSGATDRRAIRRAGRVKLTVNATDGGDVVRRTVTLRT